MSNNELPSVIGRYQCAHDAHDTGAALATFAADATVIDDGQTFSGLERIGWWLANAASEFTFTRTLLSVDALGDGEYLVRNHLAGNFPGGEVDLNYRFRVSEGLIEQLEIAP